MWELFRYFTQDQRCWLTNRLTDWHCHPVMSGVWLKISSDLKCLLLLWITLKILFLPAFWVDEEYDSVSPLSKWFEFLWYLPEYDYMLQNTLSEANNLKTQANNLKPLASNHSIGSKKSEEQKQRNALCCSSPAQSSSLVDSFQSDCIAATSIFAHYAHNGLELSNYFKCLQ